MFVKGVRDIIERKRAPKAADSDACRFFDYSLNLYVLSGVGKNDEEVWSHEVDEGWIRTLLFSSDIPNTVEPDR